MSDSRAFAETVRRVHEGNGDEFFEVCPDPECEGRVQIRLRSPDGKEIMAYMAMDPATVPLLCKALNDCALEVKRGPE
jgi:hypothetical protein